MFSFIVIGFVLFATARSQHLGFGYQFQSGSQKNQQSDSAQIRYPGPTYRPDVQYQQYRTPTTSKPVYANRIRPDYYDYEDDPEDTCVLTSAPPHPQSNCCGIDTSTSDRIVGGSPTDVDQYPWLVQIEYLNHNGSFERECGGFLISGRYVLSAAHCFQGDILKKRTPKNVVIGEYDSNTSGPDCIKTPRGNIKCTTGAEVIPIEEYVVHPKYTYNKLSLYNDIALVRLSKIVDYTVYVRPICLPTSDVTIGSRNLRFDVAGWGAYLNWKIVVQGTTKKLFSKDGVKRHVNVPYVDEQKCSETYTFLDQGHICAGGEKGKDSCRGDSGSPLMYLENSVYQAVGLVSTALEKYLCGKEDRPAVYTKVYRYLDWINANIKP